MKIKWPELQGLIASEFTALLERVDPDAIAAACTVPRETVDRWAETGVPAGPAAALLRHVAALNNFPLNPLDAHCLLCSARATSMFGSSYVCNDCAQHPLQRAAKLGYHVKEETRGDPDLNPQHWLGIGALEGFERPVCALMKREPSRLFGKPKDPEIGHEDFDAAIHIETDDYEGFFDVMQHPRRRELAKLIASSVVPGRGHHGALAAPVPPEYRRRLNLAVVLLVWSLVNDRSEYR